MNKLLLIFLLILNFSFTLALADSVKIPHVVFLNPSTSEDPFFAPVTSVMTQSATSLGINLEVIYSNISPIKLMSNGIKIINQKVPPDYIVMINDNDKVPKLMRLANKKNIKIILFNEIISEKEIKRFSSKGPKKLDNWIGSVTPDDEQAGYILAKFLTEKAKKLNLFAADGKIHLVGLNGGHRSNSPILREKGLKAYVSENDDVILGQVITAFWSEQKAKEAIDPLLSRYPKTAIVWSASDKMAIGAITGLEKIGYTQGKNILTCGIDWLPLAFNDIEKGRLSCSIGGHLFDGAWLMVLLLDHFNHKTDAFFDVRTSFSIINRENLDNLKKISNPDFLRKFDFKQFSQAYGNNRPKKFGVHLLLKNNL